MQSPDVFVKLGNAFRLGRYVNVDYSKAFSYYKKASELNDKDGYCWLGFCYEKGYGVAADIDTAVQLYQKADQLGSSLASGYLGTMYAIGKEDLLRISKRLSTCGKKQLMQNQDKFLQCVIWLNSIRIQKIKKNGRSGARS